MYKTISLSDIIGAFFKESEDLNAYSLENVNLIEREIIEIDSFIQVNYSNSEKRRVEYLGENNVTFTPTKIFISQELPPNIKERFIRCYYGLDNECKQLLSEVVTKMIDNGKK